MGKTRLAFKIAGFAVNQLIKVYKAVKPNKKRDNISNMSCAQTIVVLESENRHSGSLSDAKWVLDDPIRNICGFRIHDVEIPFSFYPVNSYNNTLYFQDNSSGGQLQYSLTLTAGVYTPDELATEIQTALNATTSGYTVTYNDQTMKFTVINAFTFQLHDNITYPSTCMKLIGLDGDSGLVTSWASDNVIDLSYTRHILLESNLSDLMVRPRLNNRSSSIVHRFPINGAPGDVMSDPARVNCMFYVNDRRNLSQINIKLVDDTGNIIDLNGQQFTVTLMVEYSPE